MLPLQKQMLPPLAALSQRSLRCLRQRVRVNLEIPVQCSRRFFMSLKELNNANALDPVARKGKLLRDNLNGNALAVRCSGVVLKFTVGETVHDDSFLVNIPEKIEPSTNTENKAINRTNTKIVTHASSASHRKREISMVEQNIGKMLVNGKLKSLSELNVGLATKSIQVRTFKTERQTFKKPGTRLTVDIFSKQDKEKDPIEKGLLREEHKIRAMLSDPSTSAEEKESIKVAFAEGYLNGTANIAPKKTLGMLKILQQLLSIVVICILIFIIGTSSIFKLGSQQAINPETIKVTFDDVKGANDAKQELQEVVEFLRNPEKFMRVGGKLPKGVLLVGPPGTGKTLLARALAGEAGVPFFHTCGAEFDEMLVGQGARRVRDLFKTAKEQAPCVIFIDEIDAVGCKRTNTLLHPHANQTVNQLLAEMDGFNPNEGVIVLGATNRRDDLDNALLRPGRFDLEVNVASPDFQGRKEIIGLYLKKVRSGTDVDLELLARGTAGFTGADIENMVNQAAIRAGADGADFVTMSYIEAARDKALMGPEIRSRLRDDEANEITAYHEAGHALVAFFTKYSQPVHKVTIVARGASLGHTAYIPEKDKYHVTKAELLAQMDTMMGGRAAEELIFGPEKVTSGAASDLKSATNLATRMVKDWGMSNKAGLRTYQNRPDGEHDDLGQTTRDLIDNEINTVITESYERAKKLLTTHAREHKLLAEKLIKYETLDLEQIKVLLGK